MFNNIKCGKIIELSNCCCPFCRSALDSSLSKFHPIGKLQITDDAIELSKTNHMAWCCSCNKSRPHSDNICSSSPPTDVINFMCDTCLNPNKIETSSSNIDRIVTCKNCKNPVCKALFINNVKNNACNHLNCTVCQNEVCRFENCGLAFKTYEECYNAINKIIIDINDKFSEEKVNSKQLFLLMTI